MKRLVIAFLSLIFIAGCASRATAMNRLELGMTKKQVISTLGTPHSTSAPGEGVEMMQYRFAADAMASAYWVYSDYFVMLKNGAVVKYGEGMGQNLGVDLNVKKSGLTRPHILVRRRCG
jgi:hypothetical protein